MSAEAEKLRATGLVDALRRGRPGKGHEMPRPPDVELLLPTGHRARLLWDYVGALGAGRLARIPAEAAGSTASAPLAVQFTLWLYATLHGIGSAREVAELCHSHPAYRWILGGHHLDYHALLEFRLANGKALDDLLAECLAGLVAAGSVPGICLPAGGSTSTAPSGRDAMLLALLGRATEHVAGLNQSVQEAAGGLTSRRNAARERAQESREQKLNSALVALTTIADLAERERQREAEARARQLAEEAKAQEQVEAARAADLAEADTFRGAWRRRAQGLGPTLPWSIDRAEQSRFRRVLGGALLLFVALAVVIKTVKLPPVERSEVEKVPARLAKLVLEHQEPPERPKPLPVEELPKKVPEKQEVATAEASAGNAAATPRETAAPRSESARSEVSRGREGGPARGGDEQVRNAREKASRTGLLVMRDQLAALRELSSDSLRQAQTMGGGDGSGMGDRDIIGRRVAAGTPGAVAAGGGGGGGGGGGDMIARSATAGSGGVAGKAITYGGGGSLQGRETTQVRGPAGTPSLAEVNKEAKSGKRTNEEIRLAFDANKAALDGIYRRALRQNPLLGGRVVLKLTVAPTGEVSACNIVSSALNDPDLEAKLVARIQLINFGARAKVDPWTGTYQIDFLPSG